MSEISRIIDAINDGDAQAANQLLPAVYDELRKLAQARMAAESNDTLQPTALVHEAYLRLVGPEQDNQKQKNWDGRAHFFSAASEAMRRILVDRARRRLAAKRGAGQRNEPIHENIAVEDKPREVVDVHEALDALAQVDPAASQLVKLRYFGGLSVAEASSMLGISERTAHRDWAFARAWLAKEIQGKSDPDST